MNCSTSKLHLRPRQTLAGPTRSTAALWFSIQTWASTGHFTRWPLLVKALMVPTRDCSINIMSIAHGSASNSPTTALRTLNTSGNQHTDTTKETLVSCTSLAKISRGLRTAQQATACMASFWHDGGQCITGICTTEKLSPKVVIARLRHREARTRVLHCSTKISQISLLMNQPQPPSPP